MPASENLHKTGHHLRCFVFANGIATSRAKSMKRCTTGLGARFFSVMIPIGALAIGNSTGNFLMNGC